MLFAANELEMADTRFVFLSSAGVYGNPAVLPIKEDAQMNPLSPYALHKVMCEEICFFFIRNYSFDIKIARIFSAYGAGLKKQIFWDMHKKIEETGQLNMFGTGNESRDYIHIDDVVQALYLIATCNSDEVVFNVANGQETTIRQATELFAEYSCIGKDKINFNGYIREGDPINWRADISKISALGYKQTTDINCGIQDYCKWIKQISME